MGLQTRRLAILLAVSTFFSFSQLTSALERSVDCLPGVGDANEQDCQNRRCVWVGYQIDASEAIGRPSCIFPNNHHCYSIEPLQDENETEDKQLSTTETSFKWMLRRMITCDRSIFSHDADSLELRVSTHGDSVVNVKISEPARPDRHQPKLPELNLPMEKERHKAHQNDRNKLHLGRQLIFELDENSAGSLRLIHRLTGTVLLEIDLQKLIFSRNFIQLSTYMPDASQTFGLGLHMEPKLFKEPNQNSHHKTYTIFNYGQPPNPNIGFSYSSYPFYLNLAQLDPVAINESSNLDQREKFEQQRRLITTGGMMLNSNAMDVLVQSDGGITWRLVGGIVDLYLFAGPKPHDVLYQYQTLVGLPAMPPNWALGYHQSRLNYRNMLAIKLAWARTKGSGVPMESIWTDLDFQDRYTSYTVGNPELNQLLQTLHEEFDMHLVPIVDPAISLHEQVAHYKALKLAKSLDLFATYPTNLTGESKVAVVNTWTESQRSALIDFTHPSVVAYLQFVLEDYHHKLNFDGLWLDMNEPEVFANELEDDGSKNDCYRDQDLELEYLPGNRKLSDRTLCMSAEFHAGKHFDLHNLYAFYQTKAHYEALKLLQPTKRPFLISRAQFIGQSKYGGTWLGDLGSSFDYLKWSLMGVIQSNWLGQPLVGADICGFFGQADDELCARWFSLGAFYPLARNHNEGNSRDQDPGAMGEPVRMAARVAMIKRYSLLPYLYSLFYANHLKGEPVVSSMLFEYFDNFQLSVKLEELPQIDDQMMLGDALMVAPVLEHGTDIRSVYLTPGRWYDVSIGLPGTYTAEGIFDSLKNNWPVEYRNEFLRKGLMKPIDCSEKLGCWLYDQFTPLAATNLYLRGGKIMPTFRFINHEQSVGNLWKSSSIFLSVALNQNREAIGNMYWDAGNSAPNSSAYSQLHFYAIHDKLTISLIEDNYKPPPKFDGFIIYGVEKFHTKQTVVKFKESVRLVYDYNFETQTLSCVFYSLDNDEIQPLSLNKFDRLVFEW